MTRLCRKKRISQLAKWSIVLIANDHNEIKNSLTVCLNRENFDTLEIGFPFQDSKKFKHVFSQFI
jgi:hypothetical protein